MLLAKEDNLPTDYLHRNMADQSKSSSYMPPIKSSKHFLSPSQFQSVKRLPPFSYQQTPKKEYNNQIKLEPFHPPYSGMLEKTSDSSAKLTLDKFKALSASIKPKTNLRAPYKTYKNNDYSGPDNNSSEPREQSNSNENGRSNKHQDPLTTFQTFMSRLNKLQINSVLPNFEPIRFSDKSHGIVKGFSVCTNQGLVRNYNEDRVSVILNISKPMNKPANEYWPNCSIFGVFDGHGGFKCAEFLRNNLHQFIIKNKNFPWNPQEALKEAFEEADKTFLENVLIESEDGIYDKSGSCALVVMIMDDTCYVCNVGDSRAMISQNFGTSCFALSRDHKPSDKLEQKRILEAGGKVYQNFPTSITGKRIDLDPRTNPLALSVPFRILPGRLSVSRAFGDIEAKMVRFGGNPNVLIAKPEITTLKINKEHDFIFLASDGVFDKLANEEISGAVWKKWGDKRDGNIHTALKNGVEHIIKESMLKKSLDNVTGILIGFSHLESYYGVHEERREINTYGMMGEQMEDLKHSQVNQLRERESPSSHNQTPVRASMKTLNTGALNNNNNNNMTDSIDLNKGGRVTSRGNMYNQKPNDPFDFSKYMESNMRRGSESLPKLNQFKPTKGF